MLLYSLITMRDLIRNYKMIIKGKNQDSDSETEPLMSSSSSSASQGFGTVREPQIFKQESYSTESEEDRARQMEKKLNSATTPFSIQNPIKKQLLFPPSYSSGPEVNGLVASAGLFDNHIYQKIPSEPTFVSIEKDILGDAVTGFGKEKQHTHNSVVTIFAVWNTTMGSSLLAMSWGLEKTGLFPGILINVLIAALCLYTAYVLLSVNQKHGMLGQNIEVPDLCRMLIGKWAEVLAKIFSLVVLIGANIVYWILMSNFLYNSVVFIYGVFMDNAMIEENPVLCPKQINLSLNDTVILPQSFNHFNANTTFDKVWNLYTTVPIFLAVVMFPLLNFKSPTFFTKFNSLGTISVGYLLLFVAVKASNWGVNLPNLTAEFYLKPSFCALTGMLSLSYFIHNIIVSIMRNNQHQEHNGRDLSIAFGLITFTYIFIGVVFYVSFPLMKSCIEDNILNNFSKRDTLTIIARVLLLFQLFTVFPLISFMLRNDVLVNINAIFKDCRLGEFSYAKVVAINSVVLFVCIMFACFLPRIGTLIRYTGALSGLVYIFLLPSLLKMASLKKERSLTAAKFVFHVIIIIIGVLNLISQFFINDK
ncbi:sodium-coupled neutral amino acid transporter 9 homolog [Anoplophora glabripennis]|uniref:sodium-coupled neutral amino acid transporter 9 homolog n=1 Tax=Anoplophora glabripennis TaxID=217634 RepID=UPI000873CED1|nr:sodium-coupled neutral amino acid transporter 9 homolog [Anoplophora glabripennis]